MTSRNEVFKLIARSLSAKLPDNGEVEIGQDHMRMFLRIDGQVFAITVEEREQFNRFEHDEAVMHAKNFMATLPYPHDPQDN